MKHIASTQTNVKLDNQKLILRTLLEKGPMSRAELSKVLRSSKPTISKNVEELIADRRIIEAGKDDNMIGKKGILLDINPDYGHVLAIDMSKNRFRLVIANLQREWLHYYRSSMDEVIMLENQEELVSVISLAGSSMRTILMYRGFDRSLLHILV